MCETNAATRPNEDATDTCGAMGAIDFLVRRNRRRAPISGDRPLETDQPIFSAPLNWTPCVEFQAQGRINRSHREVQVVSIFALETPPPPTNKPRFLGVAGTGENLVMEHADGQIRVALIGIPTKQLADRMAEVMDNIFMRGFYDGQRSVTGGR